MKELMFVIPCYNTLPNIPALVESLQAQKDERWCAIFIDDVSVDDIGEHISSYKDSRLQLVRNTERKFALRNVVETCRLHVKNSIVAIIDGDDELCNERTVELVKNAHSHDGVVAWTAHKWDVNGINISKEMPQHVNPYQFEWCSSHLKTFDSELLRDISDANFKTHKGEWFERGYDQCLFLPLLKKATKRVYIPEVCYLYKINSCSLNNRDWAEKKQLQSINFVRARGFLE
jgi:glycosyltransferase involved in cell wall biosynthesis